jgi:DNA-binding SARP family transcriptional activator
MARLTLTLLGGFQVGLDGGPSLALPTRKIQALLAYLALPPGRVHSRDKLAALLWGDLSQGHARNSLRQALFALRRALEPVQPGCLCVDGGTIALRTEPVDVDAISFEQLAGERTPEALEKAVQLYRGDLLDGLTVQEPPFEEWLMGERERLRELAVEALAGLLAAQRGAGAVEAALQTGLRLAALDPLQEPVHRTLMRLYAQLGRRGSALHQYQLCVGVLQRELGVEPEDETKQLYREILRRRSTVTMAVEPATPEGVAPGAPPQREPLVQAPDTPLIGRGEEAARLRAGLAEAVAGEGRVMVIVGEAGVGKTRLMAELAAEVHTVGGSVLVGRCHESEKILPFGPWVDALGGGRVRAERRWLAALPLAVRRELGRLLPELGGGDAEATAPPDYLKLFEGVALLLGHVAGRQPAVLILEDLHWADEMSVRLLAFIARRLPGWRLLLLATTREEELVDAGMLPGTLVELDREPHVSTVALGPMSRSDTVSLIQALSRPGRQDATLARLGEQMWRTSEGNPLVVVEAMRAATHGALEPGLERLPLPERIRDIVGRELDRLNQASRELVARAAVIGREFEFGLLQHVSGLDEEEAARGVEELTRRRVLHSVGERLDFTHDRVREVAYSRILAPRRKMLHRRVAEALAAIHARNLEPHRLALGLHCAEGEVWDQAVVHLHRAGIIAAERSANREALTCFARSLSALAHLPDSRESREQAFEIRLELRLWLALGDPQLALENIREAEALADKLDDDRRRGRACVFGIGIRFVRGELDEALLCGARGLEIAERLGDLRLRILATLGLESLHYFRGEYERVIELATGNLAALPSAWVSEHLGELILPSVSDRVSLVMSLAQLGRFREAVPYEAEAIALAEPTGHAATVAAAYSAAALRHLCMGDWTRAHALIEDWVAVLRAGNLVLWLPIAVASSALSLALRGEVHEARARLGEGGELVEQQVAMGIAAFAPPAYLMLARGCLLLGRLAEARRFGDRAAESRSSNPGHSASVHHLLGDLAIHPDRFDAERGEAHYRQSLALAEPRGMRPLMAHCHLALGKLYRRIGERQEARQHLTVATVLYRAMDMQFWLEGAEAELRAS